MYRMLEEETLTTYITKKNVLANKDEINLETN